MNDSRPRFLEGSSLLGNYSTVKQFTATRSLSQIPEEASCTTLVLIRSVIQSVSHYYMHIYIKSLLNRQLDSFPRFIVISSQSYVSSVA